MSSIAQQHIERMDASITTLESRTEAFREIRDAILEEAVFTPNEQACVQRHLQECESQLAERREARSSAVATLETTITQCETELGERERILNTLFDRKTLVEYQDLMGLFKSQHDELKQTINHSIPMDE